MGLLVLSRTHGVTLLPTELKQGLGLTRIGSLLEEVQAEVLQLWPHSPATCEETPPHSLLHCTESKKRQVQTKAYKCFGNYLPGLWVQTQAVQLEILVRCVVLWH